MTLIHGAIQNMGPVDDLKDKIWNSLTHKAYNYIPFLYFFY